MNSSYICNCGCHVIFTIQSNVRGMLIQLTPDCFILEDRLVGEDRWSNYLGHLRTWGELKNKIISKTESNNQQRLPNVWIHLYNSYIRNNTYENIHHHTPLHFIYLS